MKKLFPYVLMASLFVFLIWNISKNWQTISLIKWNFNTLDIVLILFSLCLAYFANIFSWHIVTKALGTGVDFRANFQIWVFSNLSRFIPGSLWQYPSRVYLLTKEGVSKALGVTAVIIEGLLNLSLGAAVVFMSLVFWYLPPELRRYQEILWLFLFSLVFIFVFTNEKVATTAALFLKRITKQEGKILGAVKLPAQWIIPLALIVLARFFLVGSALFFLTRIIVLVNFDLLPVFIGISSLSWLLGYIALFVPGGLGVFEASLSGMLSIYIPFPLAVLVAVVLRLLLLAVELIFLGVTLRFYQEPKKSGRKILSEGRK